MATKNNENYFYGCETVEDCKARYKELAKKMHPDAGGNDEEFQELLNQFNDAVADIQTESPFVSDEFVALCKAGLACLKKAKPKVAENIERVTAFAPLLTGLMKDSPQKRNVEKFLGKINE